MATVRTPREAEAARLLEGMGYAVLTAEEAGALGRVMERVETTVERLIFEDDPAARKAYRRAGSKISASLGVAARLRHMAGKTPGRQ